MAMAGSQPGWTLQRQVCFPLCSCFSQHLAEMVQTHSSPKASNEASSQLTDEHGHGSYDESSLSDRRR